MALSYSSNELFSIHYFSFYKINNSKINKESERLLKIISNLKFRYTILSLGITSLNNLQ